MLADRFRDRAEDDARLGELVLEGGDDGDGIEDGIDGDAAGDDFIAFLVKFALLALLRTPARISCSFSGMPSLA